MTAYVLDTSAILTILNGEAGLDTVLTLLEKGSLGQDEFYLPFMALMELEYLLLRSIKPEEAITILVQVQAWPVQIPESSETWRHQAAVVISQTPLSVADAWIAALALMNDAVLVHKDPEYEGVPNLQTITLPYKV